MWCGILACRDLLLLEYTGDISLKDENLKCLWEG